MPKILKNIDTVNIPITHSEKSLLVLEINSSRKLLIKESDSICFANTKL